VSKDTDSPEIAEATAATDAAIVALAEPDAIEPEDVPGVIVPRQKPGQLTQPIAQLLGDLLQPYTIDLRQWTEALFSVTEFEEADPDETSFAMLAQILGAQSSEEALMSLELNRAKELCGDEPGGKSPLLVVRGARPMKSEYEEGANCYVIVDAVEKASGNSARFTTGAKAVQAVILAHVVNEWMPFEGRLTIRRQKTRRGFYPLGLEADG
jgi:hypothetical protein